MQTDATLLACRKIPLHYWSRGKQLILFPENLNVSRGSVLAGSSLNLPVKVVGRSFAGNSALLPSDVIDFATSPAFNLVPRVISLVRERTLVAAAHVEMCVNRELKQLRRRPQRQLQKNNSFNDQNNSSARASRFLVHFFDVHCTTTT